MSRCAAVSCFRCLLGVMFVCYTYCNGYCYTMYSLQYYMLEHLGAAFYSALMTTPGSSEPGIPKAGRKW
jgi:drug/metabolite transporter (DMT)-like permease